MFDVINNSGHTTEKFSRLNVGTKYNISVNGNDTFLDTLYVHLRSIDNLSGFVLQLQEMIISDEYDTDSVNIDLEILINDGISNLSKQINNQQIMNEMIEIFEKCKSIFCLCFS